MLVADMLRRNVCAGLKAVNKMSAASKFAVKSFSSCVVANNDGSILHTHAHHLSRSLKKQSKLFTNVRSFSANAVRINIFYFDVLLWVYSINFSRM